MIGLRTVRAAVSNPGRAVRNFYQQRRLEQCGIGVIQGQKAALQALLAAAEAGLELRDTPAFKWLIETYLPARRTAILEARCEVPPGDVEKQCMVQGQINEIGVQASEVADLRNQVAVLRERLDTCQQAEAKWYQSRGDTPKE